MNSVGHYNDITR